MLKLNTLALLLAATFVFTSCQKDSSSTEESAESGTEQVAANDLNSEAAQAAEAMNVENDEPTLPPTTIEWATKAHDFGDIPKGQKQKYVFEFTNTGNNPLVVSSATAGCGCTVPKKPEAPIAPGEKGQIEVEYNGSGNGKISKNVTVLLNTTEGKDILNITANVQADETASE